MTTSLEADLRREFDATRPPGMLTFSPDSVLHQGSRSIRRRRIMASGSAAVAVGLIAVGTALASRPDISATPRPATSTAPSGIVAAEEFLGSLKAQVEVNRDPGVSSNVRIFVTPTGTTDKGRRQQVGLLSTARPGQTPQALWKSGMVDGHPFTIGVIPGTDFDVKFVGDASYAVASDLMKDTGYSMFAVQYQNGNEKDAARPVQIASISWSGPSGIVDGFAGDIRLTGQILRFNTVASEKILLRPGKGGRTIVSGEARIRTTSGGYATPQAVATTDAAGVAVVTGFYPLERRITVRGVKAWYVGPEGAPIAAGILPAGASGIAVILTTDEVAHGLPIQELLPDGRVVFAITAESAHPSKPSKDLVKAITWTNADGTKGRKDVIQQPRG